MNAAVERAGAGKRRILIADDNDGVRAVISFYFTALHCETIACNDINSTLAKLEHEHFDLVVLDLYLGDEPGMEILRWMDEHELRTPTVLMSGSDDIFAVDQARRLGIIDFWPKPTRFQSAHRLAQRLWPAASHHGLLRAKDRLAGSSALALRDVVEQVRPQTQPHNSAQHQRCAQPK